MVGEEDWLMIGDALSCNLRFNQAVVFASNERFNTLLVELKSNALICHVRMISVSEIVGS
jgi:hypothetical protein